MNTSGRGDQNAKGSDTSSHEYDNTDAVPHDDESSFVNTDSVSANLAENLWEDGEDDVNITRRIGTYDDDTEDESGKRHVEMVGTQVKRRKM